MLFELADRGRRTHKATACESADEIVTGGFQWQQISLRANGVELSIDRDHAADQHAEQEEESGTQEEKTFGRRCEARFATRSAYNFLGGLHACMRPWFMLLCMTSAAKQGVLQQLHA